MLSSFSQRVQEAGVIHTAIRRTLERRRDKEFFLLCPTEEIRNVSQTWISQPRYLWTVTKYSERSLLKITSTDDSPLWNSNTPGAFVPSFAAQPFLKSLKKTASFWGQVQNWETFGTSSPSTNWPLLISKPRVEIQRLLMKASMFRSSTHFCPFWGAEQDSNQKRKAVVKRSLGRFISILLE
jgi:hypothetical protein